MLILEIFHNPAVLGLISTVAQFFRANAPKIYVRK